MALQLKKGPKNQIWDECVAVHRGDNGNTIEDKFEILIRLPADTDSAAREAGLEIFASTGAKVMERDAFERRKGEVEDDVNVSADGVFQVVDGELVAVVDSEEDIAHRIDAEKDYLRRNVLGLRKLIDADGNEVVFDAETFEELMGLRSYRQAMVQKVRATRSAPEAAGKKSSKR